MFNKFKKIVAIAGLSGALFGSLGFQAHAATQTVTVHKGDTLWKMARAHHVTLSQLEKWNKLKSGVIRPGEKLIVTNDIHTLNKAVPKKKTVTVTKTKSTSLKIYKQLTVKASAYTGTCPGCSGFTSTGINLKTHPNDKIIAVDPSVIPLGSKVYVEGYGYAIAADTGGFRGNEIDVFIPSERKAIEFGVKHLKVTIYK